MNDEDKPSSFVNHGAFTEHYRVFSDFGMSEFIYCSREHAEREAKKIVGKNGWAIILKTIEGMTANDGNITPLEMEPWL